MTVRRLAAIAAFLAATPAGAERRAGPVRSAPSAVAPRPAAMVPPMGASRPASPPVVIKMRSVPVPAPHPVHPSRVVRDARHIVPPARDARGRPITASPVVTPPPQHVTIVRNPNVTREIENVQVFETTPDFFYWHYVDGVRFCHYYDDFGVHWYGFYEGPTFYWTRYWGDRWWWFDSTLDQWVYFGDGYWWWQSPAGVSYAYVNNNYYPYEDGQGGVTVKQPQIDQPPPAPPSGEKQQSTAKFTSPDGTRAIEIFGGRNEAFLYSAVPGREPVFLKYLARDVKDARFGRGKLGKASSILLDFTDGSYALYDLDGNPLDR